MRRRQLAILGTVLLGTAAAPAAGQNVIPLPHFEGLEVVGGGDVIVRPGPVQRVTLLEGSAEISDIYVNDRGRNRGNLVISACRRNCPNRYRLRVEVQMPQVEALSVRGGGSIVVGEGFGRTSDVAVAVSGGGQIDTRALFARNAAAAVQGGGNLLVGPSNTLAASIMGGGLVRYWGNPQVSTSIMGGGRVLRADQR